LLFAKDVTALIIDGYRVLALAITFKRMWPVPGGFGPIAILEHNRLAQRPSMPACNCQCRLWAAALISYSLPMQVVSPTSTQ
jgi:hypothetical protein